MADTIDEALSRAMEFSENLNYEAAIAELQRVVAIDPKHAEAHFGLADTYFKSGRFHDSIQEFKLAIEYCPSDSDEALLMLHYNLGVALHEVDDNSQAIVEWEKTLKIDPSFSGAHNALATLYSNRGNIQKAAYHLDILNCLEPHSPQIRNALIEVLKEAIRLERISPALLSVETAQSRLDDVTVEAATKDADFAILILKLDYLTIRCEESRRVARSGSAKAGAVMGGIVGALGGPLGIAAGAVIGAKFFGGSNDRRDVWSPVFDSIQLLRTRLLLGPRIA